MGAFRTRLRIIIIQGGSQGNIRLCPSRKYSAGYVGTCFQCLCSFIDHILVNRIKATPIMLVSGSHVHHHHDTFHLRSIRDRGFSRETFHALCQFDRYRSIRRTQIGSDHILVVRAACR